MEDPLGLTYCTTCKDNTSNIHTSANILCQACKKPKTPYHGKGMFIL